MQLSTWLRYLAPLAVVIALGGGLLLVPTPAPATAEELAAVAVGYMKSNKNPFAWQSLREALALEPRHPRVNYVSGMLSFQEGKSEDAERYFKTVLEVSPDDVDTLLTLGAVYHQRDQYDKAESLYQAVRRRNPENAKAAYNLGMLAIARNDLEQAKTYLEEYLRLNPKAEDLFAVNKKIGRIKARLDERRTKRATR